MSLLCGVIVVFVGVSVVFVGVGVVFVGVGVGVSVVFVGVSVVFVGVGVGVSVVFVGVSVVFVGVSVVFVGVSVVFVGVSVVSVWCLLVSVLVSVGVSVVFVGVSVVFVGVSVVFVGVSVVFVGVSVGVSVVFVGVSVVSLWCLLVSVLVFKGRRVLFSLCHFISLRHCACSKSHISESPPAHKPCARNAAASPLSQYKVTVTMSADGSSGTEVINMQFDIVASAYTLHAIVGHGHQRAATIHMASHNPSNTQVAVKCINLEHGDREFSYIQDEIVLNKQLYHDNILPHFCSFIHQHELWIIMPPMGFGSCRDLMHAFFTAGLPETSIMYVLRDVLRALEYLHSRGIIHRGVKASHVLISGSGQVCLTGLHNSFCMLTGGRRIRTVHDFPDHSVECLQWFSPEILEQNLAGYNTKSDIYSVGILACELANGQAPFTDMPVTQMLLEKINGTKPMLADSTTCGQFIIDDNNTDEMDEEGRRKTAEEKAENIFFQRTFDPHLHNLVSLCLEREPSHRPTATQLLNHPCFKSLRGKSSEILPDTLQPVTPLTNLKAGPRESSVDAEIAHHMNQVSMEEGWEF
ncbi:hypothetical protein ACOMHN_060020 [Nucella lapillus]